MAGKSKLWTVGIIIRGSIQFNSKVLRSVIRVLRLINNINHEIDVKELRGYPDYETLKSPL